MLGPFQDVLAKIDPLPVLEGPDKTMPLPEAIKRFTRPGMSLHMCTTHNRPGAVNVELTRAWRGQQPGFTLSCIGFTSTGALPVFAGLVKKLISTFCGESYPTPAPHPIIHRAWLAKEIEIENWSIMTLPARLMAGAMGLPHIPSYALVGSSMVADNRDACRLVEDPGERPYVLLQPLRPDLAFIHAPCADRAGNVILTPPNGEDAFGALAAKIGTIVTVDKIVSTDYVRRNSHLCRIPSHKVVAVCETPLGAHPGGVSNQGLPDFESYADDYDFILEFRQASKTPEGAAAWVKAWIDERPSWDAYLEKLGHQRIWALKGKAKPDSWKSELLSLSATIPADPAASPIERMVVEAGARIAKSIQRHGYDSILAGVGASNLAAWLAYYRLREQQVQVELMAEIGFYGYAPRPADPFIFNYRNMPTSKMLTGIPTIMGMFMGGADAHCIGSIGAGQVDSTGAVNSTLIPGLAFLTGSGGANDICSNAAEVVVTALQGKTRFVDRLGYVTSPGQRVRTVVSDLGVFEKPDGQDHLVLTAFFADRADPSPDQREQLIRNVKDQCGWPLQVAATPEPLPPPELDQLKLVRVLDPRRQFLGKR